jgi:hypothetical protein
MAIGLTLIAVAFIRWPPVEGLFGVGVDVQVKGDEPPPT